MPKLKRLKDKWMLEGIDNFHAVNADELQKFQNDKGIILPDDIKEYFETLNGTGGELTDELYEFYSIDRLKRVADEFKDWEGTPNYQALLNMYEVSDLFVFANFSFNLFSYAIRLHPDMSDKNDVYVLCGNEYKKIANSFSEFLVLYLDDSIELQLNK